MDSDRLKAFKKFEKRAKSSRLSRWLYRPIGYPLAICHAYLLYPRFVGNLQVQTSTFWGDPIDVPLPAGLDIFLTGGKSHDSEIRLIKWMLENISPDEIALDIGAHIGFFSLLLHSLMSDDGRVFSFEPSRDIFLFLEKNLNLIPSCQVMQIALSDQSGQKDFYAYPMAHSEFNTMHPELLSQDKKASHINPELYQVSTITLDAWVQKNGMIPTFIKMDVEGSEYEVLMGGNEVLRHYLPRLIMEFQIVKEKRAPYVKAVDLGRSIGYIPHEILQNGSLKEIFDIENWADQKSLESDNIVLLGS